MHLLQPSGCWKKPSRTPKLKNIKRPASPHRGRCIICVKAPAARAAKRCRSSAATWRRNAQVELGSTVTRGKGGRSISSTPFSFGLSLVTPFFPTGTPLTLYPIPLSCCILRPAMADSYDAAIPNLRDHLRRRFGFQEFRHGQHDVIEAVLAGRDVLAVMPTGQGKSLCFQLPA